MSYDPRTIAFGAEILHPPIQLRTDAVQKVHDALFKQSELAYQNFQVQQDGVHLSNPAQTPGSTSIATFTPDRIVLREEFRPCTVEEFATRVVNVVGIGQRTLGVQVSLAQQFWARSLVNPRHVTDTRALVAERMLVGGHEAFSDFGRPLHTVGVRLAFPPTESERNTMNVRIEPWTQDPRSLWIEVVGQFGNQVTTENLPQLSTCLYAAYKFLTGPTLDYVARYDTAAPA